MLGAVEIYVSLYNYSLSWSIDEILIHFLFTYSVTIL